MASERSAERNAVSGHELNRDYTTGEIRQRSIIPAIRWGAVLAGVAVGISVQLVLTLLGIATGLSTIDLSKGANMMSTGPMLWAGFSMVVAAFFGGYVAARMSGLKRKADGVLHGAVSWAVTTIMFAVLATSIGGTLISGVFNNMNELSRASDNGVDSPVAVLLHSQGIQDGTIRQLRQMLQAGQRTQAIDTVAATTGWERERAATIVDQALILSGLPQSASQQTRSAAQNAMDKAGVAAWIIFIAVALALAIGISGGALGAASCRRITWVDGVPPHR